MKIEVKAIKVAQFASQETLCFSATLYIDGIRVAIFRNDGNGGCHHHDVIHQVLFKRYMDAHKEGFEEYDRVIDKAVGRHLNMKELKRWLKKLTFITDDCKPGQVRQMNNPYSDRVAEYVRTNFKGTIIILNELSIDKAYVLVYDPD